MTGRVTVNEVSELPVATSSSTELHSIHIPSYASGNQFPKSRISGFSGNTYHGDVTSSISHPELVVATKPVLAHNSISLALPSFSDLELKSRGREQLPNLSAVLNKIQYEQRLPLPKPTIPVASTAHSAYTQYYDAIHKHEYPASIFTHPYGGPGMSVMHTMSVSSPVSRPQYHLPPMYGLSTDSNQYPSEIHPSSSSAVTSSPYVGSIHKNIRNNYTRGVSSSISASSTTPKVNVETKRRGKSVGSRRYQCKICSKFFTTSGHLARHTRIHTGVKNHVCPFEGCNARFSRQDNCMQHYKTHLNGKKSRRRPKQERRIWQRSYFLECLVIWEFLNIAESSLIYPVSFISILYLPVNDVCTMGCILHMGRRYGRKHLPSLLLYFILLPSSYFYCYVIIIRLSSFSWRHIRWDRISTSPISLLAFYALFDIFFVLFLFSPTIDFIYRLHGFFFYRSVFSLFFFSGFMFNEHSIY